jgi:hypothetical protein
VELQHQWMLLDRWSGLAIQTRRWWRYTDRSRLAYLDFDSSSYFRFRTRNPFLDSSPTLSDGIAIPTSSDSLILAI